MAQENIHHLIEIQKMHEHKLFAVSMQKNPKIFLATAFDAKRMQANNNKNKNVLRLA